MRKRYVRKIVTTMVMTVAVLLTGVCVEIAAKETEQPVAETEAELEGDYYIDLSELGMKLTFYLHLDEEGTFLFSNALDFETNKSSGTVQPTEAGYLMVYDSVNGEEKSVSDGLTTSFVQMEDGSLEFSGENGCIYYGSARATASSAEDSDAKLIAYRVPDDFEAPESKSEFQMGTYTAEAVQEDGTAYTHTVSFFEDNTYLHLMTYTQDDQLCFASESGTYSVSTTQLALQPEEGERVSCEVSDSSNLVLSVWAFAGAEQRTEMKFAKTEERQVLAEFAGTGSVKGSDVSFDAEVTLYTDGSYVSEADGFTEAGVLVLNTANGLVKQYPDHPESGVRGLNQVVTVPVGELTAEDGLLTLKGLRVRRSESLNRDACDTTQIQG